MALLAVLMLVAGFVTLIFPDPYVGEALYEFDKQHTFRVPRRTFALDVWGVFVFLPQEASMDYLKFIARVTSHISDKGKVMIRYYGHYSNVHRGKMPKIEDKAIPLFIIEQQEPVFPSNGWAELIRKVCETDPLFCPKWGCQMRGNAEDPSVSENKMQ